MYYLAIVTWRRPEMGFSYLVDV